MAFNSKQSFFGQVQFQLNQFSFSRLTDRRYGLVRVILVLCLVLATGCSLPQVSAESRLFLDLSLAAGTEYQLASAQLLTTGVSELSGLDYDRSRDRLYGLAGDPPSLYTLALPSSVDELTVPLADSTLQTLEVEGVTQLTEAEDLDAPIAGTGIVLTPRNTFFMVSNFTMEPFTPPQLSEFKRSGTWLRHLPLPKQYGMPSTDHPLGVQPHLGLKALALNPEGDRLFTATQAPLSQDLAATESAQTRYSRLLHYWIAEPEPLLISEHLYPLDSPAGLSGPKSVNAELVDIVAVDSAGHFLSLERSKTAKGESATIYQFVTGVATDTSQIRTLPANLSGIAPILKRPLLTLDALQLPFQNPLPNFDAMVLGPYFADGSRSLVLMGHNPLEAETPIQFLVLQLTKPSHPAAT